MFRSLHPSPSSGTGKEIQKSRFEFPTDKPDNFVSCGQCGWNKDMDRCLEGDTRQAPITYGTPVTATVNQPTYNGATGHSFSDTTIEPTVVGGCPFCGSANSRGRLVGSEFGRMTDISNL